ncbi:MAG: beta-lactamase-like protein [Linnemannia elongata]|nr:MAG: beta-lactamase-like protein [Linnemannia elongata]
MYDLPDLDRFVEVRPGLYRCTIIWPVAPGVAVPVSTFLVKGDIPHDWVLIDSGAPMQVDTLLKAIDQVLTHEKDSIRYICITHAHIDHTGAAPALLEKYPGSKVVIHEDEKPFICDGKSFRSCTSDTWTFTLLKHFSHESNVKLPHDRTLTLRDGDKWEFEHVLKLVETQGHTPGSVSYLHIPSRSIMVGDAIMNIAAYPMLSKIPCISGPLAMSTCHWGNAMKAIEKITTLKEDVDTVFPAHDYNPDGIHIQKVHEFHFPPSSL